MMLHLKGLCYISYSKHNFLSKFVNIVKLIKYSTGTLLNSSKKVQTMKLSEEQMNSILKPGVLKVSEIFTKYGYEIRVSGGAVRDILRGIIPTDIDFATLATPDQMKEMFSKEEVRMLNLGGEKHGTVTVRVEEENFECTTLRIDKVTDGRHAEVEFVTDWALDAGRRDLTVNSLLLGIDGTVYDYHDGIKHLKNNQVLFVGHPDKRIQEDYLRILRYFRFFGRLTADVNSYDQATLESIQRNCQGLAKISGERIWTELKKILTGRFGGDIFIKMIDCGVGPHIGLPKDFDCENMKKISTRLENTEFDPCTLLASGFISEEDVLAFVHRVKCSNKDKDVMLFIIKHRDSNLSSEKVLRDMLVHIVYREKKMKKVALSLVSEYVKYVGRCDLLGTINNDLIPTFPLKGGMLVDKVEKKKINSEMKRLLELWIESDYTLREEDLIKDDKT